MVSECVHGNGRPSRQGSCALNFALCGHWSVLQQKRGVSCIGMRRAFCLFFLALGMVVCGPRTGGLLPAPFSVAPVVSANTSYQARL